jgi:hypothetical protein
MDTNPSLKRACTGKSRSSFDVVEMSDELFNAKVNLTRAHDTSIQKTRTLNLRVPYGVNDVTVAANVNGDLKQGQHFA